MHSVINIAGAGADTTGNLIAMAIYLLLRQPDRWETMRRDRSLIPAAIEESLRYGNVVRGLARRTLSDVEIEGVRIPKGEFMYIALASANRDEAAFAAPDTFDIHRPGLRNHLAFGKGAHTCLGCRWLASRRSLRSRESWIGSRAPRLRIDPPHYTSRKTA